MDTLKKARVRLLARIDSQQLKFMPGLADDLRAIVEALQELELRDSLIAAVVLQKHYWPTGALHKAEIGALSAMGQHPAAMARTGAHGQSCVCSECMPIG